MPVLPAPPLPPCPRQDRASALSALLQQSKEMEAQLEASKKKVEKRSAKHGKSFLAHKVDGRGGGGGGE